MFNFSPPRIDIVVDRTVHALDEPPGAILVSVLLQYFFQGIVVIEAGKYYEACYGDSVRRNCFVAFIVLLSLGQTAFEGYIAWEANVNQRMLLMIPQAWFALFLNGFISGVNKLFLLRRCWRVTQGSRWIFVLLALTMTTYTANILIAVALARLKVVSPQPDNDILSVVAFSYWTTSVLVLDVILSAILAFFLWRNKTGVHHLDRALLRFCAVATESAIWPSLCVAVSAGLFFSHNARANRLVLVFLLQTGKLYTLSILRTLNAKVKLRERMKSDDLARGSLGNWSWRQAEVNHAMSLHSGSSIAFRTAISTHPPLISTDRLGTTTVDNRTSMLSRNLQSPLDLPIHSNSPDQRHSPFTSAIHRVGVGVGSPFEN